MSKSQKSSARKAPAEGPKAGDGKGEKINAGAHTSKWQAPLGRTKQLEPGLYVTATPIGNLEDMTLRALRVLEGADLVLCEDTRVTAKLLSAYGIKADLAPYHDHNGPRVRPRVLADLAKGARIALVSDAGTPLISDPGYKLVAEARAAGHAVHVVPGASSVSAALSVAGLPTDRFMFVGFLPPKSGARKAALEELKSVRASIILLEGPSRLAALLRDAGAVLGAREAAVARELTKLHEDVRRGTLQALSEAYEAEGPPKGEIVVVIAPPTEHEGAAIDVDEALRAALETGSVKDAAAEVAELTGRPRREIYARALQLSKDGA